MTKCQNMSKKKQFAVLRNWNKYKISGFKLECLNMTEDIEHLAPEEIKSIENIIKDIETLLQLWEQRTIILKESALGE